jgi:hypothetical protein
MARDSLAPPPPGMPEKRKRLFARGPSKTGDFAMVQPQRSAKVTSSALRQISDETRDIRRRRRNISQSDRTWQQEAYDYAKKVGELGYLLNLQANVIALCLFPLRRWDEETNAWAPNDPNEDGFDDKPENVMDAFVGPTGGARELYRRCAVNLYTAGETHLLGSKQDSGNGILWEFLSVLEMFPDAEGNMVRKRAGINAGEGIEHLPEDAYTARCWRSAAAYTDLAESEVQRVLPILQEIVNLTQMVDATVKSRIPANMIFIPDELSFAEQGKTDQDALATVGDDEDDDDPFISELFEHMTAPVEDPKSAARLVPIVIRGKGEHGQSIKVIELSRALDFSAQDLRQEALGRLAAGLDTPPEIMQGRANVNHWTSAIIDQDFIIKHIVPVGQLMSDFMTVAYLRPMLEAFEGFSEEEAMGWRIDFDPSPVIARADESKSARDLADLLSDQAIVEANGFEKGEMVQPEEQFQRRLWQLVSSAPAVFAKLLPMVEGFEKIPIDEIIGAQQQQPPPDGPVPNTDGPVPNTDGLVDATTGQETPGKPEGLSLLVERLAVASDFALARATDRAGSRILSAAQGEQFSMVRERVQSVKKSRVPSLVSPSELSSLKLTKAKLLDKAWDELGVQARTWIGGYLADQGVDRFSADDLATFAAHQLCEGIREWAEDRILDDFKVQPNGLRVPADLITGVLDQTLHTQV